MKLKIFLVSTFFILLVPALWSQTFVHQRGEWTVGVGVKTSTPGLGTDWGEFNVDNQTMGVSHDAKPGLTSIGMDAQVLYYFSKWVAAGVSFGDEYFDYDIASGLNMDVDTRVNNFLLVGRIFLNPDQKYKVYIPMAAGIGHIMAEIDMQPEEQFHYTGFAGHIGLGVERLLNDRWGLSAELRYNYNKFHDTQVNGHAERIYVYPALNYISLSFRADYRF